MAHHQLFEWERRQCSGVDGIPVADAERLVEAARRQAIYLKGKPRAFDLHRNAISARNMVGVVSADGVSCEILPKVDRYASGDPAMLRRQLVHMLAVAYDLPIADDDATTAGAQDRTLLDVLIERFVSMLETAIRRGVPRSYVGHGDDLPALRGRLNVMRQFTSLAAGPHRVACLYDEFSEDIAINQVMKATVAFLYRISRSLGVRRRLAEMALMYADVSAIPRRQIRFDAIVSTRGMSAWMPLVRFAKLLLEARFQDTTHGESEGLSLLFDMNALFERYVDRLLRPIALSGGLSLHAQGGGRPCLVAEDDGSQLFSTYPDLRFTSGGVSTLIIDTKWKRLIARDDDPKMGISQSDVYQMIAYAKLYDCPRVVLLYPLHPGLPSNVLAHHRVAIEDRGIRLTIATVDVRSHARARELLERLLA